MHGQSLVKVGQIQSNLIDDPNTTRLGEIHIQVLIIRIEEYGDILMLVKLTPIGWSDSDNIYSHIGTQHMSIMCHT